MDVTRPPGPVALGGYRIEASAWAAAAWATVYLAEQERLGRKVALKVISAGARRRP